MIRIVKPKNKRVARVLEKRAPKLEENVKKLMLLHGSKVSNTLRGILSDLHHLKKSGGNSIKLSKENGDVRPFEGGGEASLEFMCQKTDCSLFVFASHSKKRPNNLVLGRMFDHHLYDMVEIGVENYKSVQALGGGRKDAPQEGSKPCFVFLGEAFETQEKFRQLKEILLDFFRGEVVETINLSGLDRVIVCVAAKEKVAFRHCAIVLKAPASGSEVPHVGLVETGPALDFTLRRNRLPSEDLKKVAMRRAMKLAKKVKNVRGDSLAGKVGRIYMRRQEVEGMPLTKMKGLKRERRQAAAAAAAAAPAKASTADESEAQDSQAQDENPKTKRTRAD